jgi:hypothetical protein
MPAYEFGQVYNNGVKYIKINRYDSGGLDRSNYLEQLQSITLTYPDRSAIEYPIVTIQEQSDFYLFGITPGYSTSSKGEILDYSLRVTQSSEITASYNERVNITNYSTVTTNPLNYFTASSGVYYFHKTPNVGINYSWSAEIKISTGAAGLDSTLSLSVGGSTGQGSKIIYDFSMLTSSSFTPISGSGSLFPTNVFGIPYAPIENSYYIASIYNSDEGGGGGYVTIRNFRLQFITSSAPFTASSSLAVFEPDAVNFDYDDYNPLLDNAEIPQYSTIWMDVDYSQNPLTPVNFELILSGTADRAYVQDSNYSSKAWSNLRYNGSRTNSYRIIQ